ncbi:MAG: hypothetical protein K2Q22_00635, partial [Cytophagales bacterium]|nr:hypothetical protein [Cytophagales bacterium]
FFKSMCLSTEFTPIVSSNPHYKEYFSLLEKTLTLSNSILETDEENPEALFFNLGTHGYLALLYSKEKLFMKSMSEALTAYRQMKQAIKLKDKNPDFYFFSGLYYYYLDQYPNVHPNVKPLMMFFEEGNRVKGLLDLDYATKHGVFTKTEAKFFSAFVYLKYENKPLQALPYIQELATKYPKNLNFQVKYIETLLACEKFETAENQLERIKNTGQEYFNVAHFIYGGILQEKYHHNIGLAKTMYAKGINLAPKSGRNTTEMESYGYAGLARISHAQQDEKMATKYYSKCLEIAEYTNIRLEAKKFLGKK